MPWQRSVGKPPAIILLYDVDHSTRSDDPGRAGPHSQEDGPPSLNRGIVRKDFDTRSLVRSPCAKTARRSLEDSILGAENPLVAIIAVTERQARRPCRADVRVGEARRGDALQQLDEPVPRRLAEHEHSPVPDQMMSKSSDTSRIGRPKPTSALLARCRDSASLAPRCRARHPKRSPRSDPQAPGRRTRRRTASCRTGLRARGTRRRRAPTRSRR